LIARSLARIVNTATAGGRKIGVNEILRGYAWDTDTRKRIHEAAQIYKKTIAGHLVYNPGEPRTNLEDILQKIEEEKRRLGHAPIVVIDYLQLITGADTDDTIAIIKKSMLKLKEYANDNNTLVFAITANNRASMTTGQSGLNSGRDSSNIEYGADLHMGLEYEAVVTTATIENGEVKTQSGKTLEQIGAIRRAYFEAKQRNAGIPENQWIAEDTEILKAYRQYCTRYVVRVNKNRYGDSERIARFTFDGERAQFMEIDTRY
jgi:replicative DNA helicase